MNSLYKNKIFLRKNTETAKILNLRNGIEMKRPVVSYFSQIIAIIICISFTMISLK